MFDVRNVKVGDEVAYAYFHNGRTPIRKGFATVSKINGHGHIFLSDGTVFNKQGYEYKVPYHAPYLMDADELREIIRRNDEQRNRNQLVRDMIKKLEDSFTYAGTAHISDERKAELQAMLNQL